MANPYDEEPYKTGWDQGYDYGVANPSDTSPAAPDFSSWGYDETTTGYIAQVWQEGALAGREEGDGGYSGGDDGGDVDFDVPECSADGGDGAWSYSDEELYALYLEGVPGNVEGVDWSWEPPAAETGAETEGTESEEAESEEAREHS